MPHITWDDTRSILSEVKELFSGREDMSSIEEIMAIQDEVRSTMHCRETDAKAIIKALSSEVNEVRAAVSSLPAAQESAKTRLSCLDAKRRETEEQIQATHVEMDGVSGRLAALTVEEDELQEKQEEIEEDNRKQAPRVKYALTLYGNILGIKWKYDDANPQLLQGYITDAPGGRVRDFCMDCTKESTFTIASCLWDLVDPPTKAPESQSSSSRHE